MGAVYLADDVRLGRLVAVKFVASQLLRDSDARRRFEREARNAATITHDALVRVHDLVEDAGEWALVMEYIAGPTLDEVIRDIAPLALDATTLLVRAMADGLTAMHACGLVHRDLKPSNVIVTRNADGRLAARILDFGIARRFDDASQSITATGAVSGTLAFMAPEQVAGDVSDAQTDVFALAAVTLAALTGPDRRPAYVIAMRGRQDERLRDLPDALAACLASGLQTDRARRAASPRAFAEAIRHASESLPGWRATALHESARHPTFPREDASSSASSSSVPVGITRTARAPLSPDAAEESGS
jgi:eukaryotic-like serine/threonine-protein kinase